MAKLAAVCLVAGLLGASGLAQTAHLAAMQTAIASMDGDSRVAVDSVGNVYVSNSQNVYKETLQPGGGYVQSLVANASNNGSGPEGVAVDASGNVYISTWCCNANSVFKETLQHDGSYVQTPIGGSIWGRPGGGIAVDSHGNIYVADTDIGVVMVPTTDTSCSTRSDCITLGTGSTAGNSGAYGVAVDSSDNVYIPDNLGRVLQVPQTDLSCATTSDCIEVGPSGLSGAEGYGFDGSGNLYIADTYNSRVVKVLSSDLTCATPSDCTTVGINLSYPESVAVDASGNIFISNNGTGAVLEDPATVGPLNFGNVNDYNWSGTSTLLYQFDSGGTLGSTAVLTQGATGLDFQDAGNDTCSAGNSYNTGDTCYLNVHFYPQFSAVRYGAAELLDGFGNVLTTTYMAGAGSGSQTAFYPGVQSIIGSGWGNAVGVAVDASGNVYAVDQSNQQVWIEKYSGGSYTPSLVADNYSGYGLSGPTDVAVDGAGNVYIADYGNSRVVKESLANGFYTQSLVASVGTYSITVDGSGIVYIPNGSQVLKETLQASGSYTQSAFGSGMNIENGSVAVDGAGNVYIADQGGQRVVKETYAGSSYVQSVIDSSANGLSAPLGIVVDGGGSVYIADQSTGNVYKDAPSGSSYSHNLLVAGLSGPIFLAIDGGGNLYIDNNAAGQFLKLDVYDAPTLTFASTMVGAASSGQLVILGNIGNAPLVFPQPNTGHNPSISTGFSLLYSGSSACPQVGPFASTPGTLAVNATCEFPIDFTPVLAGSVNGALSITDNSLNQYYTGQTIQLNGSSTAGSATQLAFTAQPPSVLSGGNNAGLLTVNVQDAGEDIIPGWSPLVTLTVTGPAGYSQSYGPSDASSGSVNFDLSGAALSTAGIYTYTATSSPLTPAVATETLLATAPVGSPTATQTATVHIANNFTLASISVVTQGATGQDFAYATGGSCTVGLPYHSGDTCTVNFTFTPKDPGARYGAAVLYDSNPTAQATAYLTGTGNGPLAVIYPGTQTLLASSSNLTPALNSPYGVAVDGSGNVYIADFNNSRVLQVPPSDSTCATPSDCIQVASNVTGGLSRPYSVAVDGAGNVYISDYDNNRVLKVPPTDLTCATPSDCTVVGKDYSGPGFLAVDGSGNLYIIDRGNSRVLMVPPTDPTCATACTIVGNGFNTASGIAVDGSGNVYVSQPNFYDVAKIPASDLTCANPGDCTAISVAYPYGVAVDAAGDVYTTGGYQQLTLSTPSGGSYTSNALTPANSLSSPNGIVLDGSGNVYIADSGNNRVLKINPYTSSTIAFPSTYLGYSPSQTINLYNVGNQTLNIPAPGAGGNPNVSSTPAGISLDASSTCPLLTSSSTAATLAMGTSCTYTVDFAPTAQSSYSGSLVLTDDSQNSPETVSITGSGNTQIPTQVVYATAPPTTTTPVGAGGTAGIVTVNIESADGLVFLLSTGSVTLTVTGPAGYSQTYGPTAAVAGLATFNLSGVVLTSVGTYTYTATSDALTPAVATETLPTTEPVGTPSSAQTATVTFSSSFTLAAISVVTQGATGLDFNAASGGTCTVGNTYNSGDSCTVNYTFTPTAPGARYGTIVFSDSTPTVQATVYLNGDGTGSLAVIYPGTQSVLATNASTGFNNPTGLAEDGSGNLYIADYQNSQVLKETLAAGVYTQSVVADSSSNYGLNNPYGVAVDGAGNVYIADTGNARVLKETPSGGSYTQSVVVHSGLNSALGVAVDGNGNVYIADNGTSLVTMETLSGGGYIQSVVFSGAFGTNFNQPFGVGVDNNGNVYIADALNNRVVKETLSGGVYTPSLVGSGLRLPVAVEPDNNGNVYISDAYNNRVLLETLAGGVYSQMVIATNLAQPFGLAPDDSGNLYFMDRNAGVLWKLDVVDAQTISFATPTNTGTTDTTDGPLSASLWNLGNAALPFPVPSSGNNPSIGADFTLDSSNTCPVTASGASSPGSLAFGTSCVVAVDFTPTAAGSLNESLMFTDNSPVTTQTINLSGTGVSTSIIFNTTSLPDATAAVNYGQTISVSGGNSIYSFSITSGALPAGLTLDLSAGSISGTPTAYGSFSFTVTATDTASTPDMGSQAYTLNVNAPVITLTPASGALTGGTVGVSYSGSSVGASGGNAPYSYALVGGSLPPGMSIDSGTGAISGTPTGGGTFSFQVEAYDSSIGSGTHLGSASYSITIAAPTIAISPGGTALADGMAGSPYGSQSFTVTGGTMPYSFSISAGALPPGFIIDQSNGTITGIPSAPGYFSFTVTATDSSANAGPYTGSQTYSITIDSGPATHFTVSGPASVYTGVPISVTITALDSNNNTATNYSGTVHLSSSDSGATLGADATLTGGSGIFSATFATGGGQSVTATDTGNSGLSGSTNITVNSLDVWVINSDGSLSELYENGAAQSNSNAPITGNGAAAVVFDGSGNIWIATNNGGGIREKDVYGNPVNSVVDGGISSPTALAVDGLGDIWVANGNGSVSEIQAGSAISPTGGFVGGSMSSPNGIAIDISGNLWMSNAGNNSVTEIIGGAPPTQPLAIATQNNTIGARP